MNLNWNNNDTKYILKRFIIYILICIAMFIIGTWSANAAEVQNPRTIYWWCNQQRNNTNIVYSNDTWNVTMTCNNANFNRYLQEWYLSSTQSVGKYKLIIPNNPSVNIYDFSDRLPVITLLNTNVSWTNPIYSGVCSKDNSMYIECEFYANEPFNYINMSSPVGIGASGTTYITLKTGQYQLTKIVDNEEIQNSINDTNDTIKDSSVDTNDADNFYNNNAFSDSTGLESVIQLPLNMVNSLTNTCQSIQITIPFIDYTGDIPCMSTIYQSKFNTLYVIVKLIINGFFVYRLLLKIYELVHNAKQPDEDKLEVIEL